MVFPLPSIPAAAEAASGGSLANETSAGEHLNFRGDLLATAMSRLAKTGAGGIA
jgi:hypothetical protein